MNPETYAPLIALFGLGTFTLIGMRMFLAYRARRLELTDRSPGTQLEGMVEELRQEVQALRGDIGELHERVDFAERLLTRGRDDS